jgi:hypothetical protein
VAKFYQDKDFNTYRVSKFYIYRFQSDLIGGWNIINKNTKKILNELQPLSQLRDNFVHEIGLTAIKYYKAYCGGYFEPIRYFRETANTLYCAKERDWNFQEHPCVTILELAEMGYYCAIQPINFYSLPKTLQGSDKKLSKLEEADDCRF